MKRAKPRKTAGKVKRGSYGQLSSGGSRAGGGTSAGVGSVVNVAGAGYEVAAAGRRDDGDGDGAVGAVGAEVGRVVAEDVLIADVVGDLVADVVNVLNIFREVGKAAGSVSDFF